MNLRRLSAAAAVLALVSTPAAAKNISISISPTVEVQDGVLTARVQVNNSGDEAAQSVAPVLRFGDKETRGEARAALAPNEAMSASLSLPVGTLASGRWPFRLAVDYTDANQYPFQALHMGLVNVGSPPPAKLSISEVTAPPLSSSGSLRVKLKNLAGVARQASVTVAVPEGVEVTKPVQNVSLAAWAEGTLSAPLINRTALAGSRYPVFVSAEYDDDGVHQTAVSQGILEIQNPRSFFQSQRSLLWVGAGVLIAAWFVFLLWQVTSGRARRAAPRA